uniref:Na+/H+ antiporter subunit C n=1 Tax=Ignisphaera aggregans TaxID=334771 RepID=A0A7C4JJH2_9CREN
MFLVATISLYINIAVSMYGVIAKPNLVKKFIALTIVQDSINLMVIMMGYKLWREVLIQPPILLNWNPTPEALREFVNKAVDPLPQALVLTAIVIGLAVNIFLVSAILHLYRHFNTVNMDEISKIKREMIVGETA